MMNTREQIQQDLNDLDEQQLRQVSAFIASVKSQSQPIACDRQNILQFLEQIRRNHPTRSIEEIDQDLLET
jgi:hypothetical protein